MSFNKITIVGHLGHDPELRATKKGTPVCNFSMATTERRRDTDGEPEEHTTWFNVTVWGRQAQLAGERLAKGYQVYVEGRLRLEEYLHLGKTRMKAEVTATDVQFLDARSKQQRGEAEDFTDEHEGDQR